MNFQIERKKKCVITTGKGPKGWLSVTDVQTPQSDESRFDTHTHKHTQVAGARGGEASLLSIHTIIIRHPLQKRPPFIWRTRGGLVTMASSYRSLQSFFSKKREKNKRLKKTRNAFVSPEKMPFKKRPFLHSPPFWKVTSDRVIGIEGTGETSRLLFSSSSSSMAH